MTLTQLISQKWLWISFVLSLFLVWWLRPLPPHAVAIVIVFVFGGIAIVRSLVLTLKTRWEALEDEPAQD